MMCQPTVVSLFAGIGGICLGFKQAGFNIVWANEKDAAACRTYRHNFGASYLIESDIKRIDETTIPKADVLIAGFPCQSFSIAGKAQGFDDPRGQLFFEVVRVIKAVQPKIVFLENVENLIEHDDGRTFQIIFCSLAELGYIVKYRPMATHEYANIPQTRRRIYIVCFSSFEMSKRFSFPRKLELTKSIVDFLDTDEKQPDIYYYLGNTQYEDKIRSFVTDRNYIYRVFNGEIRKLTNGKCPTLTASMISPYNAAVIKDNWGVRRLTLRECLQFQGFPEDYYFPKSIKIEDAYKQIGNSVSVPVIKRLADEIKKTITT